LPPRRRGFLAHWDRHPAVPTGDQLTRGERAADQMRNGLGSWSFVFWFMVALVVWVFINSVLKIGGSSQGFDPYPYILLNLFLSMMAGLQGAILLIAAKRSDQIASLLAQHDYETNKRALERIEALNHRLEDLATSNQQLLAQNTTILAKVAADQS
jgi:uncharacterized membrane protein